MASDAQPPGPLRASDAERERTVELLRAAAGDGRLTLEELAERVEGALVAKTRDALEPLTADLPSPALAPTRREPAPAGPSGSWAAAIARAAGGSPPAPPSSTSWAGRTSTCATP